MILKRWPYTDHDAMESLQQSLIQTFLGHYLSHSHLCFDFWWQSMGTVEHLKVIGDNYNSFWFHWQGSSQSQCSMFMCNRFMREGFALPSARMRSEGCSTSTVNKPICKFAQAYLDRVRSLCVPWKHKKSQRRACIDSRMLSTTVARLSTSYRRETAHTNSPSSRLSRMRSSPRVFHFFRCVG